jgi:toxin ParE1/3/4
MGFRLRPKAARDILSIMNYIAVDNQAAALKWHSDIFDTFRLLGEVPGLGTHHPGVGKGLRMFPKSRYPIFFHQIGREAEIVRVVHSAREWQKLL